MPVSRFGGAQLSRLTSSSSSSDWLPPTASLPAWPERSPRHVLSTPATTTSQPPAPPHPLAPCLPEQPANVSACPRGLASVTHSICVISRRLPRSRFAPPANAAANFISAATPRAVALTGSRRGRRRPMTPSSAVWREARVAARLLLADHAAAAPLHSSTLTWRRRLA